MTDYILNKTFDSWNTQKKQLHSRDTVPAFSERQVWWVALGKNIGFEEDGKNVPFERPFLVLRKYNRELFYGVPLTTQAKDNEFHYKMNSAKGVTGYAILSQGRTVSARRLLRRIYWLSEKQCDEILQKERDLIERKSKPQLKTGESRTANADLYPNDSKLGVKSQALNKKSGSAVAESSEPEGYSNDSVAKIDKKVDSEMQKEKYLK
jgi:mRNA interferase MazF